MSQNPPSRRPTVLVVDDQGSLLQTMAESLAKHGYEVLTAENGKVALKVLEIRGFVNGLRAIDVILSDVMMPEMDGREFLAVLRQGRFRDIPFVLMSGQIDLHGAQELVKLDVDGVLIKPFAPGVLRDALEAAVKRRALKAGAH